MGVAAVRPSTSVDDETEIAVIPGDDFVSRAGRKLDAALDAFAIDVAGRRAIDLGASTGGFTDCLLRRGAASVLAVDVGSDQLDSRLRSDPRVVLLERTDLRTLDPEGVGAPFDLVVADLSFISLRVVARHIAALGGRSTDHVLLVKPQFEVGRTGVGKGGVVRSDELRREALRGVLASLAAEGMAVAGTIESPVPGRTGNRELLVWLRATDPLARVTGVDQDGRHG